MKDTIIYSHYDIGDTLYLTVRTSEVNQGYVIASGIVLDIVTCASNGCISYKMRLSDGTVAVEDAGKCFKDKDELKRAVLASIDKGMAKIKQHIVISDRLVGAFKDETDTTKDT